MSEIDLEEVAAIGRAAGVEASVGGPGDGSATVYVGELHKDGRVAAIAGPGWYTGPACRTRGRTRKTSSSAGMTTG